MYIFLRIYNLEKILEWTKPYVVVAVRSVVVVVAIARVVVAVVVIASSIDTRIAGIVRRFDLSLIILFCIK